LTKFDVGAGRIAVTPEEQADSIRKRMAELRRELTCDMQEVSRSAKAMTSPSFYIRKFPWATMAVAAGIGYLLIPKKKQVVQPDMEALAELVRKNQVSINASKASEESQGMMKTLAVMGLSWAARAGMNYVVQQLTATGAKGKAPDSAPSSPVDEPTKVEH
jgi:hypothetical protein